MTYTRFVLDMDSYLLVDKQQPNKLSRLEAKHAAPFEVTQLTIRPCRATTQLTFYGPDKGNRWDIEVDWSTGPMLNLIQHSATRIEMQIDLDFSFNKPEPLKETRSCPVCYGTGFHKGFGAPCSKGCKAP